MKNKNTLLAAIFSFAGLLSLSETNAQTTPAATPTAPEAVSPFKVTADLVSSYIWRGTVGSPLPNFQPTLAFTKGNFEIGAWGSTAVGSIDIVGVYKELDLYASYTMGPIKLTLTDYNWDFAKKYFNYKSKETGHIFEGTVGYTGPASFPLSITANVMFAGEDKKWNDSIGFDPSKQNYSTYIEFGYACKFFSPFIGITPSDGYYGDSYGGYGGFSVCNIGITSTRNLKITDSFSLPLKATLGFNPQKEDAYLVFGITF